MSAIDKIKLKKNVMNIKPRGSTNLVKSTYIFNILKDLAFDEAYKMINQTVAIDNFS